MVQDTFGSTEGLDIWGLFWFFFFCLFVYCLFWFVFLGQMRIIGMEILRNA